MPENTVITADNHFRLLGPTKKKAAAKKKVAKKVAPKKTAKKPAAKKAVKKPARKGAKKK